MKARFILFTDEYPQYKINLNTGCLISYCDENDKYYCLWIKNKSSIEMAIGQILRHFKSVKKIKLVGDSSYFSEINTLLSIQNLKIDIQSKQILPIEVIINIQLQKMTVIKTADQKSINNYEPPKNEIVPSLNSKIKILIIDDSETIQKILSKIISTDSTLEVVKCISNPIQALEYIKNNHIDVITLDIHMPEMDGVSLLKNYINDKPIPTIIVSSISMEEGPIVLSALEAGAIDYIQKPSLSEITSMGPVILDKIKSASSAKVNLKKSVIKKSKKINSEDYLNSLVVIGSSTGGTEALKEVFLSFPNEIPPVLVVQHIPKHFSKAFADRLNDMFEFTVKEAEDGDIVKKNQILIAPGGQQMKIFKSGSDLKVQINNDPPVNRHAPSVDYFFYSVAELNLKNVIGVILTGMGADGAKGLLSLKLKGAETIAQNEESCVVFGMPKEAIKAGAASEILPLNEVANRIIELSSSKKMKTVA